MGGGISQLHVCLNTGKNYNSGGGDWSPDPPECAPLAALKIYKKKNLYVKTVDSLLVLPSRNIKELEEIALH